MSEEARNILRKAAVPTEFNKVVGEMMPRPGTPSFHGPDRPSVLPDTKGEPRLISPEALRKCPEERSLPSPVSDLPRYLPNSRIDATGMHHRTPGLQQFVDLPLGRLGLITGNPSASMGPSRSEPRVPFGEIRPWPPPGRPATCALGCRPIWCHQTSPIGGFKDKIGPLHWQDRKFTLCGQAFRVWALWEEVPSQSGSIFPSWALKVQVWKLDETEYCRVSSSWPYTIYCGTNEYFGLSGPYWTDAVSVQVIPRCDPTCWPSKENPLDKDPLVFMTEGDDVSPPTPTGEVMLLEAYGDEAPFSAVHLTSEPHYNDRSLRFVFTYSPPGFDDCEEGVNIGNWNYTHMCAPFDFPVFLPWCERGTEGKPVITPR